MNSYSLVLGTRNLHKVREIRSIWRQYQSECPQSIKVKFIPLTKYPQVPAVKEDGRTYLANARQKSLAWAKATHQLTLAEDSGLEVKALNWAPGIYSARFASKPYASNNQKLLDKLKNVPLSERIARYRCCAVIASPHKVIAIAHGVCYGKITLQERGRNGFGYDPLFVPNVPLARNARGTPAEALGRRRTFGQLPARVKHTISHRAKTLRRIFRKLPALMKHYSNIVE